VYALIMTVRRKLSLTKVSTALLLSIIALPVSVISFAVLYATDDAFWAALWLGVVLPTVWAAAVALGIIDVMKRHSWGQAVAVVALLAPTVLLVSMMVSPRFAFHQLFTFRPLELDASKNGFVFIHKFTVCLQGPPCTSDGGRTETRAFKLKRVPEGCCSLRVLNGWRGQHTVNAFRIVLNGRDVELPKGGEVQTVLVELNTENEISIQVRGTPDAYIYVFLFYPAKTTPRPKSNGGIGRLLAPPRLNE
jgi:hypothetical protein